MGLEQFIPIACDELVKVKHKHKLLKVVSEYIHEYMLPIKQPHQILRKITQSNFTRCADNPIKYYFKNEKAPVCIQYVIPLEQLKILPPCQRKPEELPHQWKNYIYPPVSNFKHILLQFVGSKILSFIFICADSNQNPCG